MDTKKVTWIREATVGNGIETSVSDSSGIVKIVLPGMNFRSVMLYADEFFQLLDNALEIRRYLEANTDVAFSRDQSKESRKIKRGQEKTLRGATNALSALSPEQLAAIITTLQKKQA
jgi:hypothetical protein